MKSSFPPNYLRLNKDVFFQIFKNGCKQFSFFTLLQIQNAF